MRKESGQLNISGGFSPWRVSGRLMGLMLAFALLASAAGEAFAGDDWPKIASSADGTPIFPIHGWSCETSEFRRIPGTPYLISRALWPRLLRL
jgi:hypothetical protein